MSFGPSQPTLAAPTRAKVYVVEFSPTDRPSESLSQFARRLFQLRFVAVPGLEVAKDTEIPPCGLGASESMRLPAQAPTSSPDSGSTPSTIPVFYKVQGTVDMQGATSAEAESNIVFAYELVKIRNCRATLILRRTRTFGLADALQNLEDAAEEVNSQLNGDMSEKIAVKVVTIEVLGDPKGKYRANDLLTRFIRERVADGEELRLWDDTSQSEPAYTLEGLIQFTQTGKSEVAAKVEFVVNGERLPALFPTQTVEPTVEALIPFYLGASKAAVKGLSDLFHKERAGLNQLSSDGADALIERAKQLLCVEPAADRGGCTPDPQAALLALNEAQSRTEPRNRAAVMILVGQSRFQSQEYLAAGEAYDSALAAGSEDSETRVSLLRSAADAWYEAKDYRKAADRYRECVEEASGQSLPIEKRLQSEARLRLVRSLLLADQPQAALDAFLDSLRAARNWPNPDDTSKALYSSLSSELDGVLSSLPSKELESATDKLASGLAFDPALEAAALKQVARAIGREGRHEEAIAGYRKVLTLKPDDADTHYYLGKELDWKSEYDQAIAEYRAAITLKRDDAFVHNDLGVAYFHKRQYTEAIAEFRLAIGINSDYALAYNNLANALLAGSKSDTTLADRSEAEKLYQQAIRVQPSDTLAYFNLWSLYRSSYKSHSARRVFTDLQKVAPNDRYTQLMLATMREDTQDFVGAAEIYSKLHEQYPEDSFYLVLLAEAEISGGMNNHDRKLIQTGMQRLEQELSRNPGFDTYFALAFAYHVIPEVRNLDEAEKLYREALKYRPDNIRAMNNLAALALGKGDLQAAIEQSKNVLKRSPQNLDALQNLGYARFLTGDLHGATECYEKEVQIAPDDPLVRLTYGEALFWLANTSRAHEQFEKAHDILSRPEIEANWTWIYSIDSSYDATEKRRFVYYSTVQQKRALVELFQGLTYLQERSVASALESYRAATGMLSVTHEDDKEVVRKAINDLHRLEQEPLSQPEVNLGLGFLYDWLGETAQAVRYWKLHIKSGADAAGLEMARARLAGNVK